MLISLKYKFICLNPPKTGTVFRKGLFKNYIDYDYCFKYPNQLNIRNPKHMNYSMLEDYAEKVGLNLDDFYKFTFVRNPWRRMLSWCRMLEEENPKFKSVKFVKNMCDPNSHAQTVPQSRYYLNKNNEIAVDFIGSFEILQDDLKHVLKNIGLNIDILDNLNKKITVRNYHKLYSKIFTPELIELIKVKEDHVIKLKNYEYDL